MTENTSSLSEDQKSQKIQSLREMITSAESTIHSAKSMLLELEGKKKAGRKRKIDNDEPGYVVQGAFDGQIMIGADGKQYPVPANYASKSKLVQGDLLKLHITPEGHFIYKQVGPAPRQNHIGLIGTDAAGNYFVAVDGRSYKVLLAAITYFKAEPGDEVVVVVPSQEDNATWAAIENVLQHHNNAANAPAPIVAETPEETPVQKTATEVLTGEKAVPDSTQADDTAAVDEWVPDIDAIEQEIRKEMNLQKD